MDKDAINISRYINNRMNLDERLIFESEMETDPFLNDAVLGFQTDPKALQDLPLPNAISVSWWYAFIGLFAVAVVFLSIPNAESKKVHSESINHISKYTSVNTVSELPEGKDEFLHHNIEATDIDNVYPKLIQTIAQPITDKVETFVVNPIFPKPTTLVLEHELPTLRVNEKIRYIQDLKVIDNKRVLPVFTYPELSDLMDFTPANFSTTVIYKRTTKYQGIFPSHEPPTYFERLEIGLRYYKSANYERAIAIFSVLIQEDSQDANAVFYSALSHYELGNYHLAVDLFLKSESGLSQTFIPESRWFRAMSLMQAGKKTEALVLLQKIVDGGGHYAKRANEFCKSRMF